MQTKPAPAAAPRRRSRNQHRLRGELRRTRVIIPDLKIGEVRRPASRTASSTSPASSRARPAPSRSAAHRRASRCSIGQKTHVQSRRPSNRRAQLHLDKSARQYPDGPGRICHAAGLYDGPGSGIQAPGVQTTGNLIEYHLFERALVKVSGQPSDQAMDTMGTGRRSAETSHKGRSPRSACRAAGDSDFHARGGGVRLTEAEATPIRKGAALWDAVAYACRYETSRSPSVVSMTWSGLRRFNAALGRIVKKENEA